MSLSVNLAPLEVRFRERLESALQEAEATIAGDPGRVLVTSQRPLEAGTGQPCAIYVESVREGEAGGILQTPAERRHAPLYIVDSQPWPAELPGVVTAGHALAIIRESLAALAQDAAADVEGLAALVVPDDTRAAVLARDEIVNRWRLPTHGPAGHCLRVLREVVWNQRVQVPLLNHGRTGAPWEELSRPRSLGAPHPPAVPPEVALDDVVKWARTALARGDSAAVRSARAGLDTALAEPNYRPASLYGLGVLYSAWLSVDRDRRKPAIAIDAGKVSHGLLMGWTQAATDRRLTCRDVGDGFVELLFPGQTQIMLGLPGEAHERLISALQDLRSPRGLRTYATLLHLLSIRGQRQGFVRWTLDEHLDVQGVPRRERRETRLRSEVGEVELLTQIELAVRDTPNGRMRERRPLFIIGSRFERLHGSKWRLDGMELQANPLIWRNVRDPETGRLAANYGLGAEGLPRLNPHTHPAALALGLILPIRFRLALNDSLDYHDLTGQNVLRYAGLPYSSRDPNRTWRALADDLDELVRLGGVRRWEWKGDGKPSVSNVLRFYMADAHRDRMALGVRPLELPAARPLTGDELRSWRAAAKLSQARAAAALGVGIATVKRAEAAAAEPLGPALREALREALAHAHEAA